MELFARKKFGGTKIAGATKNNFFGFVFAIFGLFLYFYSVDTAGAQTIYVPPHHWVYDFLDRLETEGVLPFVLNGTRPMTRKEIAGHIFSLIEYGKNGGSLSKTDRERLQFLKIEFREELEKIVGPRSEYRSRLTSIVKSRYIDPWLPDPIYANGRNFLSVQHGPLHLYWDPIFARQRLRARADTLGSSESVSVDANGFRLWGTLGDHIGFVTDIRDTKEWGTRTYPHYVNTTAEGLGFVQGGRNYIYHDETKASVVYDWKYLTLQYGKDANLWGPGYRGQLALSDHATSYDLFKLQVTLQRFKFTSLVARLQHYVPGFFTGNHQQKAMAAHRAEFSPFKYLDVGLYETVIYANRSLEPAYLNPVMFFRSAEHYLGDRDNVTMGLDFEVKGLYNTKFYGELFLDDITTSKLGTGFYGNKYAYLLGAHHVNLFGMDDLDLRLEYARIRPYTYTHKYELTSYRHYSTGLGHWIGPNSDDLFVQVSYQYSRRLGVRLALERYRHGANPPGLNVGGDIEQSHLYPRDPLYVAFLQGIRQETQSIAVSLDYEVVRNGFIRMRYCYGNGIRDWPGHTIVDPGKRSELTLILSLNE